MLRLYYDLTGKPAVFLSNILRYYNGLTGLEIYRNVPDQAVPLPRLKAAIDDFEVKYEGAIHYDRLQIGLRDQAREEVTELFKKVLAYLQMIATKDDIPALLQAGITVRGLAPRKKATPAPAGS